MFLNLMQLEDLNLRLISHSRTSPVLVFYSISVLCVGFFMGFMSLIHWRSMVRWNGGFAAPTKRDCLAGMWRGNGI